MAKKEKDATPVAEPVTEVLATEAASAVPEGESGEEVAPDAEMKAFLEDEEDDLETLDVDETPTEVPPEKVEGKAKSKDEAPEGKAELAKDEKPAGETPAPEEAKPTEAAPKVEPAPEQPPADAPTEPVAVKPEPVSELVPEVSAEELAKQHREWREGQEKFLTEHYAIDDTLAEELDNDPRTVIPKLLARVYMDATLSVISHIQQNMPAMVNSAMQTRSTESEAEGRFYEAWPQLKDADQAVVGSLGNLYRQMNPKATEVDFIRDVGASAMVALKLPMNGSASSEGDETPSSETPAAPFKPAGQSPPKAAPSTPTNLFTKLDEDFDVEDLDLD